MPGKVGCSYVRCSLAELVRLMLGQVDLNDAGSHGPIGFSTSLALDLAQTLFRRLPVWLPPWDDLAAGD